MKKVESLQTWNISIISKVQSIHKSIATLEKQKWSNKLALDECRFVDLYIIGYIPFTFFFTAQF